jgi:hypothetical protein
MAHSTFKSRAVPLYVDITTTAPTESAPADTGFLANTILVPNFSTGSFGWKGHNRMVVELPKAEGEEDGEKVHVMLTYVFCSRAMGILTSRCRINATVIGSKYVKEVGEHEEEPEEAGEHAAEEASGEAVGSHHEQTPEGEEKESRDKPPTGEEQAEESAS